MTEKEKDTSPPQSLMGETPKTALLSKFICGEIKNNCAAMRKRKAQ